MDVPSAKSSYTGLGVSHLPRDQPPATMAFKRRLGGTEAMYNYYLSRGTEVVSMSSRIESVYPVTEKAARWALQCLMSRHPLLRSTITHDMSEDEQPLVLTENSEIGLDFKTMKRSDWLDIILDEVHIPFVHNKPLWRCRMLNDINVPAGFTISDEAFKSLSNCQLDSTTNELAANTQIYNFNSMFIFIAHHSVIDGGYITWLFQEFVNFLDAYITRTSIGLIAELPLLPPIEECVRYPPLSKSNSFRDCSGDNEYRVGLCYEKEDQSALKDYSAHFKDEITSLSKTQPKNDLLFFKYDEPMTTALMRACVRENCRPPGVLMAACIMAMIDLIYPDTSEKTEFEIPVDFMLDLRRHYKIKNLSEELIPYYTGLATSTLPISVRLKLAKRPIDRKELLRIADILGTALQYYTLNPNPIIIEKMMLENETFVKNSFQDLIKQSGKSPFVLCFSNVGRLDNLLHESLQERIRLTDVQGHSSTLIDQMPIFFVTTLTVNGSLMGSISYCSGFTSPATALAYTRLIRKYLDHIMLKSTL